MPDGCFKCGEPGHWALRCPTYFCRLCEVAAPGHYSRNCPNFALWTCTNCNLNGHLYITCPIPLRSFPCKNCGEVGHGLVMCPLVDCWTCGKIGHTPWSCPTNTNMSCLRCGESGHCAPMCGRWSHNGKMRSPPRDEKPSLAEDIANHLLENETKPPPAINNLLPDVGSPRLAAMPPKPRSVLRSLTDVCRRLFCMC